jgi:hypothetical protein
MTSRAGSEGVNRTNQGAVVAVTTELHPWVELPPVLLVVSLRQYDARRDRSLIPDGGAGGVCSLSSDWDCTTSAR